MILHFLMFIPNLFYGLLNRWICEINQIRVTFHVACQVNSKQPVGETDKAL